MRRLLLTIISLAIFLAVTPAVFAAPVPPIPAPAPDAKPAAQLPALKPEASPVIPAVTPKGEITAFRWGTHVDAVTGQSKLRLVLDLSAPVAVEAQVTASPLPMLQVDIKGAVPGKIADSYDFDGKIAEEVNLAATGVDASRVDIQVPLMLEETDYKVFTLPIDTANNKTFRVVIDVMQKVPPVKYNFTPGLRNKVIVIDPGHGGSDPGAVGLNKTKEKDITLAVGLQLKTMLEKAGAKVLMTRTDDRDVFGPNASAVDELKARSTVANSKKADAFVSIHINSFTNRSAGGTSTYYYQKTPYDALLAQSIQNNIASAGGLQNRGVNHANFYVIKRTIMPAVLTELAFISNPDEEKQMNTPQFQQKMAQGMYLGLENFFAQAARLGGGR